MEKIFKKYDKVLSLGSNCFVKSFLQYSNIIQETNFFDNIGSPMWGVCELLENDFGDLSNIQDYDKLQINDKLKTLTNKRYYLRLKHQDHIWRNNKPDLKSLNNLFVTFERRAKRFQEHLKDNKKILFIRLEQDDSKRVFYPEYKGKNEGDEIKYVKEFSKIIKRKYPELTFDILFISKIVDPSYDEENKIIIMPNPYEDMHWDDCNNKLNTICTSNFDLINTHFVINKNY